MKLDKIITFILVIGIVFSVPSQRKVKQAKKRTINIAGIVIDSKTLLPIKDAKIYDKNDKVLTTTNKDGYFKTKITYFKAGEIEFTLGIEKDGYQYFEQKEHWGDLANKINATYYVGLQNKQSNTVAFSKLITIAGNLSYKTIKESFNAIKKRADFINKVELAKEGNEDIFFEIDNNFYLINDTGWIKTHSKGDLISINGEKNVPANEINSIIKRKDIKAMSPTNLHGAVFEIFTK